MITLLEKNDTPVSADTVMLMITIDKTDEDAHGPDTYTVSLRSQLICRFKHDRLDGLADCLKKAADAVELSEWAEYVIMEDSKGG